MVREEPEQSAAAQEEPRSGYNYQFDQLAEIRTYMDTLCFAISSVGKILGFCWHVGGCLSPSKIIDDIFDLNYLSSCRDKIR